MAFEYFDEQKIDIAIIETGLGGRFDSTNIILPELSVITNIGWDHVNILGNSLEKIAYEKAGIIKQNVPVILEKYYLRQKKYLNRLPKNKTLPLLLRTGNQLHGVGKNLPDGQAGMK